MCVMENGQDENLSKKGKPNKRAGWTKVGKYVDMKKSKNYLIYVLRPQSPIARPFLAHCGKL